MKILSIVALTAFSIIIVIIGSDFLWLWLPIVHSSEYPTKIAALFMAVTALFTLFLAFATFKTIEQSNLKEQERRKDNIEKEQRDRKAQLLNDIINWATDIRKITVAKGGQMPPKLTKENIALVKLSMRFESSAECDIALINGLYIKDIVSSLWKELVPDVDNLMRQLKQFGEILIETIPDNTEIKELNEYSEIVLSKASNIKIDLANE